MSNYLLTGSEIQRFHEIQKYLPVFEPMSNPDYAIMYRLFSVSPGQQFLPELIVNSGAVTEISGAIRIEKIIHRFNDESLAAEFLTDLGTENLASYKETTHTDAYGRQTKDIEIQVINFSRLDFNFDFRNGKIEKGFYLEVFRSGSIMNGGLKQLEEKVEYDALGRLVSDTYLKYFKVEDDKK